MTIRIVIADDQELVRTGFKMILELEPDITVVGEATNGNEAVSVVAETRPDVVLMDIRMPELDGIKATSRIVSTNAEATSKVLILTTFDLDEYVFDALSAGASGFLLKDGPADQLVAGVRMVAGGDALLAPRITRRLIERFVTAPAPVPPGVQFLTDRELEILKLVALGLSNREIADQILIGESTVKTHLTRILRKLGLRDRVQVVVLAYQAGLVQPGVKTE